MPTMITATASHQGGRTANADAAAVHHYASGDVTAAAVVDGIGSDPDVVAMAGVAAEVIARTAARTTPLAGIMAAAAMTADPAYLRPVPDGVAVCAMVSPNQATKVAWIGDCRAYAWDGVELRRLTEDHTMGQRMRTAGCRETEARTRDHWVRATVSLATISTVAEVRIEETPGLLLLTSDGVHDALTHDQLADLVRAHATDPQALADALVTSAAAAPAGDEGADNATAAVLLISD